MDDDQDLLRFQRADGRARGEGKLRVVTRSMLARQGGRNTLTVHAIPVERTNLTAAERALLPDPDWVTEDDADAIISRRRERKGNQIPLEDVLKRYGYPVDG